MDRTKWKRSLVSGVIRYGRKRTLVSEMVQEFMETEVGFLRHFRATRYKARVEYRETYHSAS